MSARAAVVVTGTEVLTGRVADRNGPWLAEQLRLLGVDISHTVVVGDRPGELTAALSFAVSTGVDLVITSGGLGPTADDLTAAVVGEFQGRQSRLDPQLQQRVAAIIERLSARLRWNIDAEAAAAGIRKQAMVPEGAEVLEPVGTAPGLVVPVAEGRSGPPVLVLPGPPRELQGMWPAAVASPLVRTALAERAELRQQTLRLWGVQEPELAATLRGLDDVLGDLEVTTCLRGGELEVVTRYEPDAEEAYQRLARTMADTYPHAVYSTDGSTVDDQVADLLDGRGWTIATAESCTAGLLVARLTNPPGSSVRVLGGVAAYANTVKSGVVGVPAELVEAVGAVSKEVGEALATGVRERLGADVGVGITGVAGPGGGTPEKPVGLVHLCASSPERTLSREIRVPGSRADVRERSVTVAMHLLRELLS
ncbi:competence/damage-inducible protein A [Rhodococcus sp. X156]|uniref:competence/damage-inducible protein A n=1 Tax=Rhodococcus sp. X156 TaxID=2499145 RepID=UPI000FDAE319|nr:competence/damage-inducible protein A [Rhodococcus sp. X156]